MAYFVLLAGEHPTWISQLLARPFVVKCGEASYSLYLLHWYTMHQWAAPYAIPYSKGGRLTIFAIGVLISIALARVVYLLLERPALRWLRLNFKPLRLHITLGVAFVVITFFSIMASLQVQTVMRSHALSESASHQAASLP
jgi:peptidoglycan/LPS O-acetylase OafA/YrhL